ncbi:MAG: hypothetical protein ACK2TV_01375 [Anaerolineales bacterium]
MSNENIDSLRDARLSIDEQITSQENIQTKLQTQLDVISQAEAALSGYSQGSKNVVEDSIKGKLPPGIEPLSKHLVVEEKYEKAIGAAMGELADLLIIPNEEKSIVIKYLESKNTDRVVLVSVDQVQSKSDVKRFSHVKGYIGCMNKLIEVDQPYQELVDHLFADTLVVKDRQSALNIQPELEGTEKVVALNGFVLYANGVMISGQSATSKRLRRTRQHGELQHELLLISEKMSTLNDKKAEIEESIQQSQLDNDKMMQNLKKEESEKEKHHQSLLEAENLISRLRNQLEWHQERSISTTERIGATQKEISNVETDMVQKGEEINIALNKEKILQADLKDLPVFEVQEELNHLKTQIVLVEQALNASKKRYEDHQNRLRESLNRLEIYQSRYEDFERNLSEINHMQPESHPKIDQINRIIEELEGERISPLVDLGEEYEQKVVDEEKIEEQLHQKIIAAERKYTQIQLDLSRKTDQLDNLRERIEDDFGLVSYDYQPDFDDQDRFLTKVDVIKNLPLLETPPTVTDTDIRDLKRKVRRIGAINPEAQQEYKEVKERFEFLTDQIDDLEKASQDLTQIIDTLDGLMSREFIQTFKAVDQEFSEFFSRLFNGGEAKLVFVDKDNPVDGGVDIEVRLPGRRQQGLALLSGGERSLTAVALIFALLKVSPTPFCILDEVDAMLDESNVGRFIDLLEELAHKTQFVIITHNRNTVQAADVIYGVTMGRDSTSQMISLKLEDVDEKYID